MICNIMLQQLIDHYHKPNVVNHFSPKSLTLSSAKCRDAYLPDTKRRDACPPTLSVLTQGFATIVCLKLSIATLIRPMSSFVTSIFSKTSAYFHISEAQRRCAHLPKQIITTLVAWRQAPRLPFQQLSCVRCLASRFPFPTCQKQ